MLDLVLSLVLAVVLVDVGVDISVSVIGGIGVVINCFRCRVEMQKGKVTRKNAISFKC